MTNRFGQSFLNEASVRLQRLLGLDGLVSPVADRIETLQSMIIVGDATEPGLGDQRGRHFQVGQGSAIADGQIGTFMALTQDVIIEKIFFSATIAVTTTITTTHFAPGESAAGVPVQRGSMIDRLQVGELSPMGFVLGGAAGRESSRIILPAGAYPIMEMPIGPGLFLSRGTVVGQGQRFNVAVSGVGSSVLLTMLGRTA